jgi:hypothetical protein
MTKFPKQEVSINTLHSQNQKKGGDTALTSQLPTLVSQLLASLAPGLQCAGTLLVESLPFSSEALNLLL